MERERPNLEKWRLLMGTALNDPFLDWVVAEMGNTDGTLHADLNDCLVRVA